VQVEKAGLLHWATATFSAFLRFDALEHGLAEVRLDASDDDGGVRPDDVDVAFLEQPDGLLERREATTRR
jgi:hypothetical protein